MKLNECRDCNIPLKDYNNFFYRCPNCAKLVEKEGTKIDWDAEILE